MPKRTDAAPSPSGRPPRVYFNAKFYSGALNGVHRVADRLLRQIDAAAREGGAPAHWDMRLLLPERAGWAPAFDAIAAMPQRRGHTQYWEQLVLPLRARDGLLVSFANLAPSLHRDKLTMVHDAQFLLSPHSYPLKLRLGYRALIPVGARTSRHVLTVSEYARDSLASFGVSDPERTSVLYNGADHILETAADPATLARYGLGHGGYCLLFGSAFAYKNVRLAFDAFRRPELSALRLVVVGPTRATLAAAGLAAPEDALFVGPVGDAALRALYEGAHCLLFPSRTEGFGLPPVEAMTVGCPVIAAPSGAIPEICRDAICYADVADPAGWAAQILALTRQPDLRAAKIAAGRLRAQRFTWRRAGQTLIERIAALLPAPATPTD